MVTMCAAAAAAERGCVLQGRGREGRARGNTTSAATTASRALLFSLQGSPSPPRKAAAAGQRSLRWKVPYGGAPRVQDDDASHALPPRADDAREDLAIRPRARHEG